MEVIREFSNLLNQPNQCMMLIFGGIALTAAVTDYTRGKIYNWLTFPAFFLGLAFAAYNGFGGLWAALGGVCVAVVAFFPLFSFGIMGGGDVKLMLALGTVLGAWGTAYLIFYSLMVAALAGVVLLFAHGRARIFFTQIKLTFQSVMTPGLEFHAPKLSKEIKAPFGIAIFVGYVLTRVLQ